MQTFSDYHYNNDRKEFFPTNKDKKIVTTVSKTKWGVSKKSKLSSQKSKTIHHLTRDHSFSDSFSQEYSVKKPQKMVSFTQFVGDDEEDIFDQRENIPTRIEGTYIYDYNILSIHSIILKIMKQNKKFLLKKLEYNLWEENKKIEGKQSLVDRKISRIKIKDLHSQIDKIRQNCDKKEYLSKALGILKQYKQLKPINKVVSFISNNKEDNYICPESEEEQTKRHSLIFDFLEIARKYVQIDLIRTKIKSNSCPCCGADYEQFPLIEDDSGTTICQECGLEIILIVKNPFFADGTRINNSRNNYEDKANFEKVLMRYQGKQTNKPPKELYEKLDRWFVRNNLPSSKEYLKMPLTSDGQKPETSRELMYEALNKIKCPGYYDDINLIMHIFWGWELPNISHLEDQIMKDYDEFQIVYEEQLDKEGRKSSLNSQWRLYKHLKKLGLDVKSTDFKIPSTPTILEYHKKKWQEGCRILGWENR